MQLESSVTLSRGKINPPELSGDFDRILRTRERVVKGKLRVRGRLEAGHVSKLPNSHGVLLAVTLDTLPASDLRKRIKLSSFSDAYDANSSQDCRIFSRSNTA